MTLAHCKGGSFDGTSWPMPISQWLELLIDPNGAAKVVEVYQYKNVERGRPIYQYKNNYINPDWRGR